MILGDEHEGHLAHDMRAVLGARDDHVDIASKAGLYGGSKLGRCWREYDVVARR